MTLSIPSDLPAGDICVGYFSLDNSADAVTSAPSGWTFIRRDTTGASGVAAFWYW